MTPGGVRFGELTRGCLYGLAFRRLSDAQPAAGLRQACGHAPHVTTCGESGEGKGAGKKLVKISRRENAELLGIF